MIEYSTQAPLDVEWGVVESPIGKLVVGVTDKGEICRTSYLRKQKAADILAQWQEQWPHTKFKRGVGVVDFEHQPVLLIGTYFQYKVWCEMAKIPSGKTASYGEIAKRVGNPKAVRAVGTACGANPVMYVIPCHRVVASNGIGGYGGGLDIKKKLLKLEGVQL